MIINIPLQVDEKSMEDVLKRDYEGKILDEIMKQVRQTLIDKSDIYYATKDARANRGMQRLIEDRIDLFLENHRDEVIEHASKAMADKLARTKRGKEILENL